MRLLYVLVVACLLSVGASTSLSRLKGNSQRQRHRGSEGGQGGLSSSRPSPLGGSLSEGASSSSGIISRAYNSSHLYAGPGGPPEMVFDLAAIDDLSFEDVQSIISSAHKRFKLKDFQSEGKLEAAKEKLKELAKPAMETLTKMWAALPEIMKANPKVFPENQKKFASVGLGHPYLKPYTLPSGCMYLRSVIAEEFKSGNTSKVVAEVCEAWKGVAEGNKRVNSDAADRDQLTDLCEHPDTAADFATYFGGKKPNAKWSPCEITTGYKKGSSSIEEIYDLDAIAVVAYIPKRKHKPNWVWPSSFDHPHLRVEVLGDMKSEATKHTNASESGESASSFLSEEESAFLSRAVAPAPPPLPAANAGWVGGAAEVQIGDRVRIEWACLDGTPAWQWNGYISSGSAGEIILELTRRICTHTSCLGFFVNDGVNDYIVSNDHVLHKPPTTVQAAGGPCPVGNLRQQGNEIEILMSTIPAGAAGALKGIVDRNLMNGVGIGGRLLGLDVAYVQKSGAPLGVNPCHAPDLNYLLGTNQITNLPPHLQILNWVLKRGITNYGGQPFGNGNMATHRRVGVIIGWLPAL